VAEISIDAALPVTSGFCLCRGQMVRVCAGARRNRGCGFRRRIVSMAAGERDAWSRRSGTAICSCMCSAAHRHLRRRALAARSDCLESAASNAVMRTSTRA